MISNTVNIQGVIAVATITPIEAVTSRIVNIKQSLQSLIATYDKLYVQPEKEDEGLKEAKDKWLADIQFELLELKMVSNVLEALEQDKKELMEKY